MARPLLPYSVMPGALRDVLLFLGCVVVPCAIGWRLEDSSSWQWTHTLGALLFVVATLMVFTGVRLLMTAPSEVMDLPIDLGPLHPSDLEAPYGMSSALEAPRWTPPPVANNSSEIIHVEHGDGSARVVALLRMGDGPHDVHLLELDVMGDDLRPEVIEEAVAGVATGEPVLPATPVERVGYASGWGLTLPCPKLTH